MLFNSFDFVFFFAAVLLVHLLPLPWALRKFNLLAASYLFYMSWNPPFVALLLFSTLVDWFAAKAMGRSEDPLTRKFLLLLSLCTNLGILGFFKYADTALQYFAEAMQLLGTTYHPPAQQWNIVLPLGISFYTFQTLSYTIDVYRRKIEPWQSFLDFALFVSFFPQLIAGPIVRAGQFLPQCTEPKRPSIHQFGWGLSLIVLGMFLKIVLADGFFAPTVNEVYVMGRPVSTGNAWVGMLGFVGQLYCDFAGYSTCAVGLALCLGFVIPANFRFPLAMLSVSDFWSRWHMTLSRWLHDYLFLPLGGYRRRRPRVAFNLIVTMVLCGWWHGPTFNFLLFGLLNGIYLVVQLRLRRSPVGRHQFWKTAPGKAVLWAFCFNLLAWTLVFFRASTFEHAVTIFQTLCGLGPSTTYSYLSDADFLFVLIPLESIVIIHWLLRETTVEEAISRCPMWLWAICLSMMLTAILLVPGEPAEYVYFQF